jgi:hypothetical protein
MLFAFQMRTQDPGRGQSACREWRGQEWFDVVSRSDHHGFMCHGHTTTRASRCDGAFTKQASKAHIFPSPNIQVHIYVVCLSSQHVFGTRPYAPESTTPEISTPSDPQAAHNVNRKNPADAAYRPQIALHQPGITHSLPPLIPRFRFQYADHHSPLSELSH